MAVDLLRRWQRLAVQVLGSAGKRCRARQGKECRAVAGARVYLHSSVEVPALGQVTLYLDAETEARMKEAAKAEGVSQSRWLADLIRERTAKEWPPSVAALAGAWADMPTAEELRQDRAEETPREPI